MIFEIIALILFVSLYAFMKKQKYQNVERRFTILFIAILFFEIISEPMWHNIGFEKWTYLYRELTLTVTLGWLSIFMISMLLVDYYFHKESEIKRFFYYLFIIETITVPIEMYLLESGMRKYSTELISTMSGLKIPFTSVPMEAVWAVPLFAILVISFYKYINYLVDSS